MKTQRRSQRNDSAQHSRRGLVRKNRVDQRKVDLEDVKIETDDLHQAAVSGAKIIDRDAHSRLPRALQRRASDGRQSLPLRHLAHDPIEIRRKFQLFDDRQNVAAAQDDRRNVDADVEMWMLFEERNDIAPNGRQNGADQGLERVGSPLDFIDHRADGCYSSVVFNHSRERLKAATAPVFKSTIG